MKIVPSFPDYKITECGELFSIKHNKFIKPKPGGFKAYIRYELWHKKKRYHGWAHRLVYETYHGNCLGKHIHHKDENIHNNHYRNLEALTPKQHKKAHRELAKAKMKVRYEKQESDPF